MFRIRAQIAPELLWEHITQVETGLPGMAYVRVDPQPYGGPSCRHGLSDDQR